MIEGYTPAMRESIERVEATRPARLQETWPMMTPAEKQEVLSRFHPDYKPEGMRELKVGPSKGYALAHEFADLLEALAAATGKGGAKAALSDLAGVPAADQKDFATRLRKRRFTPGMPGNRVVRVQAQIGAGLIRQAPAAGRCRIQRFLRRRVRTQQQERQQQGDAGSQEIRKHRLSPYGFACRV